jgi:hypothetical protein
MVNLIFVGGPILVYCVVDYEFPKKTLMANPALYRIGLTDENFKNARLIAWIIYG